MTVDYFVLRTNALGDPQYFAGQDETNGFECTVVSKFIFAAFCFESRKEADECKRDLELGERWLVVHCSGGGTA